jgi:branched-chain amino acid transport system substrate-binding protein
MLCRVLALASAVLLSATAPAAAQAPIVVHHIGPLTGVLAASNAEALEGARLHLDAFNARGGLQGRRVLMEAIDDAQDPKRSAEIFDRLQADGKLLAVMMPRTTPSTEALLPKVAQHGVPMIGPQAGGSFINQPPRREVFTLRASYQKEAEVAIRQQHSIGVRTFGVLLADDAFGRDVLVGIERTMTELQLKPVAVPRFDNRNPNVEPAVREMLQHRPQVVLLIASSKASADFIKGYRAAGANATFISLSNTSNNDYIKALGDNKRGAIVMQVMPSPFAGGTALAREYGAAAAKTKHTMSYAAFYGFASARLLTQALQRAKEPSREALLVALEGLGEVDLGGFRLRYGPGERVGSSYVDPTIITQDGKFMR